MTPIAASRPNVLFITVDQWRGDLLPGGGGWVRTPHLDALAAEGTRFARHYTQAYPCGPARAGLLTGLYPHKHRSIQNGSPLDPRLRTVFQAARAVGYRPTLFGYTDTTPDPRTLAPLDPARGEYEGVAPGLDIGTLLIESAQPWIADLLRKGYRIPDPAAGRKGVFGLAGFGDPAIFAAADSETAFLTDRLLDFLACQPAAPFFAHASFIAPHPPFAAAAEWLETVADDPIPDPLAHAANADDHPLLAHYATAVDMAGFAPGIAGPSRAATPAQMRTIRRAYAALCAEVDHHLGRVFAALKRLGMWENTIVILSGDHGEQLFDHGLLGKLGWYDGSAHVPLVIRVPGQPGGQTVSRFTQSVDIFPTLVDLLGLAPDVNLDGRSLRPLLAAEEVADWRDCVFWSHDFRHLRDRTMERKFGLSSRECSLHVVRTETFKYVHFAGLPPVLHDLVNDPGEQINLAAPGQRHPLMAEGVERLLDMRLRHENEELSCWQAVEGVLYGGPEAG